MSGRLPLGRRPLDPFFSHVWSCPSFALIQRTCNHSCLGFKYPQESSERKGLERFIPSILLAGAVLVAFLQWDAECFIMFYLPARLLHQPP